MDIERYLDVGKSAQEIAEEIRQSAERAIAIEDNTFRCVVHYQRSLADDTIDFRAEFSLNGKALVVAVSVPVREYTMNEAVRRLRDAVAEEVATHILITAMDALRRHEELERIKGYG